MGKKLNILQVDDSNAIVSYTKIMLRLIPGIQKIKKASTISQAKAVLKNQKIDVAILDIHLPDGNGIDLLKWIKQNHPAIIVIMFTNNSDIFFRNAAQKWGADYFLDKSMEFENISTILHTIPSKKHLNAIKKECKILLLEDVPTDAELMKRELMNADIKFVSKRVDSKESFIEALSDFSPDIVISDHSLPQFDSHSALKIIRETKPEIPLILVTGTLSHEYAVECLNGGAYDYVLKTNLKRLPFTVKNALSKCRLAYEKQNIQLENEQLQKSSEEAGSQHKEIVDSMIYAKEIQNALLPRESLIHHYFPESFLINMPKHIVSGDFYWFSEYEEKFIVAVGDCTGHGVPAALISMMGYNKLNYIVNIMGITTPSHILDHLNSSIQEAFKQDDEKMYITDGMDIVICTIDKKNNLLEFAGANRPLYYLKNTDLEIIKGDKKCIGGIFTEVDNRFSNHIIPIDSIDSIYLFTDGFIDQFGGEFGKKFLSKRFKNLLSFICGNSMNEQKEILTKTLLEWKGNEEQTDDICLLGIRL